MTRQMAGQNGLKSQPARVGLGGQALKNPRGASNPARSSCLAKYAPNRARAPLRGAARKLRCTLSGTTRVGIGLHETINWVVKASKLCNLRCRYCYEWNELAKPDRISLAQWEKLLLAAGAARVSFDGVLNHLIAVVRV